MSEFITEQAETMVEALRTYYGVKSDDQLIPKLQQEVEHVVPGFGATYDEMADALVKFTKGIVRNDPACIDDPIRYLREIGNDRIVTGIFAAVNHARASQTNYLGR